MIAFLKRHQYLVIWILGLVIIGALTELVIQLNDSFLAGGPTATRMLPNSTPTPQPPPTPPAPSVTITKEINGKKTSLFVQWANLPDGTNELRIFRGTSSATSTWKLWKSIIVSPDQLKYGTSTFAITSADALYQYFVQAISNGNGSGQSGTSTQVLWGSDPITPGSGTPPPPPTTPPNNGNNGGNTGGSSTSTQGTGNSTTTQGGNTTSTSGNGGGSNPTGNPFYNPQIQIIGYGTVQGDFWVQHVNQSIEIGWQNLPNGVDTIIISRTPDQNGTFNQFLSQKNPGSTGSYSLQLVDGTLNEGYYYKMSAYSNNNLVGTYGPIYLPPASQ